MLCAGRRADDRAGHSGIIDFGVESCRDATLLLRFSLPTELDARVAGAFLVLQAVPNLPPKASWLRLEVAPILEPWSAHSVEMQAPSTGLSAGSAMANGATAGASALPVRIDVTQLVSSWSRRVLEDHGVAIRAASGSRSSIALVTAAHASQSGPRLDVYLR